MPVVTKTKPTRRSIQTMLREARAELVRQLESSLSFSDTQEAIAALGKLQKQLDDIKKKATKEETPEVDALTVAASHALRLALGKSIADVNIEKEQRALLVNLKAMFDELKAAKTSKDFAAARSKLKQWAKLTLSHSLKLAGLGKVVHGVNEKGQKTSSATYSIKVETAKMQIKKNIEAMMARLSKVYEPEDLNAWIKEMEEIKFAAVSLSHASTVGSTRVLAKTLKTGDTITLSGERHRVLRKGVALKLSSNTRVPLSDDEVVTLELAKPGAQELEMLAKAKTNVGKTVTDGDGVAWKVTAVAPISTGKQFHEGFWYTLKNTEGKTTKETDTVVEKNFKLPSNWTKAK